MKQTAEEILAVIGEERRDALMAAAADRLALYSGMSADQATRHVKQCWPSVEMVAAPGQVWWRATPSGPGDLGAWTGISSDSLTIVAIDRYERMVDVGSGRHVNLNAYLDVHYLLAEWPTEHQPGADHVEPPAAALPPPEEQESSEDDEERFDPRRMCVLISQDATRHDAPACHLPMLGPAWTSSPWNESKPELGYVTFLDVPAFLDANLGNYRDGWPDFEAQWRSDDAWEAFNELSWDGYDTDTDVAAYLGDWLYKALVGEVVREHGGKPDDYWVTFMWAGHHADAVIANFPLADPRVALPADHRLMQCDGQLDLFAEISSP